MEIRNIAIIAHVDHGKTTLTDALMKQTGMVTEGVSMDSNKLEQERGITIYAKNTSINYKGTKINIVDTPGHADFGSEVERVLRSIDCVLLVVDAQEGPMPQTRFVLKKSLELGLKPIVVINKIDKPASRISEVHDEVLELFLELGANDDQINFPMVYAIGREGVAMKNPTDEKVNLDPLLDVVLAHVPVANKDEDKELQAQAFNLGYDNFLGRLAISRIYSGKIKNNSDVFLKKHDGTTKKYRITKLFTFEGIAKKEVQEASSGDIVMIAGLTDVYIGDTVTDNESVALLPAIHIDEPTIALDFLVNDSPFAGKEGKFVTSRQIRDRLEKEMEINVGLKVDFDSAERFKVYGRGELHISVLLENMRREGFEIQVSKPEVIIHEVDGKKMEPYEETTIDTPTEFSGAIIEKLGKRKGIMTNMKQDGNQTRLSFEIPTRGLLGYRNEFMIDTKGEGILSSRFVEFRGYAGEIEHRDTGAMISMETGKALAYSLWNLQDRGQLYIPAATDVYAGMVIGNTSKGEEMEVNPTKNKNMSNVRSSGNDEALYLVPPIAVDIEKGLEIMSDDEYLEITPLSVRIRKKFLSSSDRSKAKKK
ncbi:MAG: translational GTPase TypA [Candidatus Paceibacterota bacterium]|jgi:GTP-binding protein